MEHNNQRAAHPAFWNSLQNFFFASLGVVAFSGPAFSAWSGASLLETLPVAASTPQIAFDSAGNAIAAWTQGSDVWVRHYDVATATWSAAALLDSEGSAAMQLRLAVDAETGSAATAWLQGDVGQVSVYVNRYDAVTGLWSGPVLVEWSSETVPTYESLAIAVRGNQVAVTWIQGDGAGHLDVFASRFDGAAWSTPSHLDIGNDNVALQPSVAIATSGDVQVVWWQAFSSYTSVWRSSTGIWSAASDVGAWDGTRQPRVVAQPNNRTLVTWRQGGGVFARQYDFNAQNWSGEPAVINSNTGVGIYSYNVGSDVAGNAIVTWVQHDGVALSMYARTFGAASGVWGAEVSLESFSTPSAEDWEPSAAINGSTAAVVWVQSEGPGNQNLYAARMSTGAWSAPQLLETREEKSEAPHIAIGPTGKTTAVWIQADGTARSVYENTFTPVSSDTEPPSTPSSLGVAVVSSTQINLNWTASTDNVGVTGYRVERCQGSGCSSFAQIATPTGTTFSDTGLTGSTSYSYRVRATDAAGNLSAYSNTASATTQAPPDTQAPTAPSGLSATATSSSQVNLNWTASTDNVGVTGYRVERCQGTACSNFAQIATPVGTTFSDSGLSAATTYRYRVRAADAAGNLSDYSSIASATTQVPPDTQPPTVPSGLSATAVSSAQINLSWTASMDNVGVTGYRVERCLGSTCSNFAQIATPAGTTFNDSGLSASTTYRYRVRATDAAGNLSGYSSVVNATTSATLAAPTGLSSTAVSDKEIDLAWSASTSSGVSGYIVERCQGAGCSNFAQVGSVTTDLHFYDTGRAASTSYSYRVKAVDGVNEQSPPSGVLTAATLAAANCD